MPFLQASSLSYAYPGARRSVHDFSISVSPGEFISVEGPSGSGKSTIARSLAGLIPHLYNGKISGEVLIAGHPSSTQPLWQISEKIGMVFQNPSSQMLGLTVEEEIIFGLENLGLNRQEIDVRLNQALSAFDLEPLRGRSPQTLSGGEQQKLALAAIMARQPDILILDEPLSMLDVTAATALVADLETLTQNGTGVVIFEHRAEYLQHISDLKKISVNGTLSQPAASSPNGNLHLNFHNRPETGTLHVENLSVSLSGHPALDQLSFSAQTGKTIAVVGRNGSGKTTLLRSLAGLQKFEGTIMLNGQQPDFGMVFQNADLQLFNATVQDEILYRLTDPDIPLYQNILLALGLTEYAQTPPLLLSEGEKKRVALATVLMRQPRNGILLDEPSLGQDNAHKQMLIRLARLLNEAGLLVVMTTHDLTLAAQADHIFLINDGHIIADGDWASLASRPEVWEQAQLSLPDWIKTAEVVG